LGVRPDIEILNTERHEYFFGLDYGYVINVELSNKGREGAAIVGVELRYGSEKWSRSQTVYLKRDETKNSRKTFFTLPAPVDLIKRFSK
jgi:hypothetical protein